MFSVLVVNKSHPAYIKKLPASKSHACNKYLLCLVTKNDFQKDNTKIKIRWQPVVDTQYNVLSNGPGVSVCWTMSSSGDIGRTELITLTLHLELFIIYLKYISFKVDIITLTGPKIFSRNSNNPKRQPLS